MSTYPLFFAHSSADLFFNKIYLRPPVAVGHAMCSYIYTWKGKSLYMNDLFVKESHRSKGVGKLILDAVLEHCKEVGCARLDFLVFDWNPARKFYERNNAVNVSEKNGYRYYRLDVN